MRGGIGGGYGSLPIALMTERVGASKEMPEAVGGGGGGWSGSRSLPSARGGVIAW